MNTSGPTCSRQLAQVLATRVDADAAKRAREALARHLATLPR
jgi:4-carboxymuconolactone decarboxylase